MQRHPIPKNIMDVEFKLFGGLGLRQLSILFFFFLMAFVVYSSSVSINVKYVMVPVLVLMGVAFSFIEIQGQSFATYMSNFLIAIVTPQRRIWKKSAKPPASLTQNFKSSAPTGTYADRKHDLAESVIDRVLNVEKPRSEVEVVDNETQVLNQIDSLFDDEYTTAKLDNVDMKTEWKPIITDSVIASSPVIKPVIAATPNTAVSVPNDTTQKILLIANTIAGRVLDSESKPCAGVQVMVEDAKLNLIRSTQTNQKGIFYFQTPLPNGEYTVRAKSGNKPGQNHVQVVLDGTSEKILTLVI